VEAVLPVSMTNYITQGVERHKSDITDQKVAQWRIGVCVLGKLVVSITPLVVMLSSCRSSNLGSQNSWNTYRNPRYNFEFPYPSNWVPFPIPENRDGLAFRDPQNPSFEIRGWAANKLSGTNAPPSSGEMYEGEHHLNFGTSSPQNIPKALPQSQQQNFKTEQGVTGKLQVEIDPDTSLMTLTLSQGKVLYNWQGRCNSEKFADCYRFFDYVARQYRLPPPEDQ